MMIDMFLQKKSPDELIKMIRQGLSTELGLSAFRRLKENLPSKKEVFVFQKTDENKRNV